MTQAASTLAVEKTLARQLSMPASPTGPIVHGDYRMDNVLLDATTPGKVAAVLDWELSTLGDPLADIGLFFIYWQDASDASSELSAGILPSVTTLLRGLMSMELSGWGMHQSLLPPHPRALPGDDGGRSPDAVSPGRRTAPGRSASGRPREP